MRLSPFEGCEDVGWRNIINWNIISDLLVYILQKEKIVFKIVAKIANVNGLTVKVLPAMLQRHNVGEHRRVLFFFKANC